MPPTLKYICFFDILGFKDLVENNPHSVLNSVYENLFEGSSTDVISRWSSVTSQYDFVDNRIELAIISDSIILYSKDSTQKSFSQMFLFARKLLQNAFYSGIPLRGALSVGDVTARNTSVGSFTIFGKGLVDAYLLEESQIWAGCLIGEKVIAHLDKSCEGSEYAGVKQFEVMKWIVTHSVKLKDNESSEFYVVNWIRYLKPEFTETMLRQSFTKFNKKINPKVQKIIDNTIDFYTKITNGS